MTRETILLIHAIIGVLIFVTGLLQIVMKKGGTWHIRIGNFYLYAWIVLLISGAYLGGLIITIIGIFGFYFTLTGARIGHLKNKPLRLFEQGIMILSVFIAVAMLYYSVRLYIQGNNSFAIILSVFGSIFLLTTLADVFKYVLKKPFREQNYGKMDWYFEHMTRMSISFIAAVTAFTSIQNLFGNNTLNFLLPTLIGVILINIAKKNYQKKLMKA